MNKKNLNFTKRWPDMGCPFLFLNRKKIGLTLDIGQDHFYSDSGLFLYEGYFDGNKFQKSFLHGLFPPVKWPYKSSSGFGQPGSAGNQHLFCLVKSVVIYLTMFFYVSDLKQVFCVLFWKPSIHKAQRFCCSLDGAGSYKAEDGGFPFFTFRPQILLSTAPLHGTQTEFEAFFLLFLLTAA